MTNKITVPSELIHRAIDAIEQVGYQDKFIDYTFVRAVKQELRDALADPVQPAGGDGFDLALKVRKALDRKACPDAWMRIAVETSRPLFDDLLSNATRLQAEVEQWKLAHRLAMQDNIKLQSELTKLGDDYCKRVDELTKARELIQKISDTACGYLPEIKEYLSNQSAPADKGQGVPVEKLQTHAQPVKWWNGCDSEVPRALRFLANNERPHGGEQRFNAAHLFQLAGEIERMARTPLYAEQPAPVAVVLPEKYDDVLLPFLSLMRAELHANAHKGDRPGWLQMDRKTAVLEVFYHMGKLHQAVHRDEAEAIKEYAADVANMCMMLTDVCGYLNSVPKP